MFEVLVMLMLMIVVITIFIMVLISQSEKEQKVYKFISDTTKPTINEPNSVELIILCVKNELINIIKRYDIT